jgi:serine/threonine-protein phosphatase 6 regulatory ankyrin repeat subunit B
MKDPQDKNRQLLDKASKGNTSAVRQLLAAKADVNAVVNIDQTSYTPLSMASSKGHIDVVLQLLAAKADVNAGIDEDPGTEDEPRTGGYTALMRAASKGYITAAKALLAANATVNAHNFDNETALSLASGEGRIDMAHLLLAAKAIVNPRNYDEIYTSPLASACMHNHYNTAKLLLQAKADLKEYIYLRDNDRHIVGERMKPLALVVDRNGSRGMIELLLSYNADINSDYKHEESPTLLVACDKQDANQDLIKFLLEKRADVNQKNDRMETALMAAACNGNIDSINLLVAAKATLDDQDCNHQFTALMCAFNTADATRLLLQAKADPNIRNYQGNTLLMYAANTGQVDSVEVLLEALDSDSLKDQEEGFLECANIYDKEHNMNGSYFRQVTSFLKLPLLLGLHKRVGQASSVSRAWGSAFRERQVLSIIFDYAYGTIPESPKFTKATKSEPQIDNKHPRDEPDPTVVMPVIQEEPLEKKHRSHP